jgi:cytochrome c peroxidase
VLIVSVLLTLTGCDSVAPGPSTADLDVQLRQALDAAADGNGLVFFRQPDSGDLHALPQDPRNPLTPEKVTLGRLLFHETALAVAPARAEGQGTYACASCHHAGAGFQAGRRQGIGEGGTGFGQVGKDRALHSGYGPKSADVQRIRTPTPLNGAWQRVVFWNGQFGATGANAETAARWQPGTLLATNHLGYEGLETQAIAALTAHRMKGGAAAVAAAYPQYRELFDAAFPNRASDERVTEETAGLAIAAYERTLVASEASFQRWLRGETGALTAAEKRGALVFFGKAACVTCHTGPALSSMTFHALGMGDLDGADVIGEADPADPIRFGRGGFTDCAEERYRFKTPQLYNLADHAAFGHGATFASIREVVVYKNDAVPQSPYVPPRRLSSHFQPLGLTEADIDDLTAFLEHGLYDPALHRYVPSALPSGNCFPANDAQSRRDLGCEVANTPTR